MFRGLISWSQLLYQQRFCFPSQALGKRWRSFRDNFVASSLKPKPTERICKLDPENRPGHRWWCQLDHCHALWHRCIFHHISAFPQLNPILAMLVFLNHCWTQNWFAEESFGGSQNLMHIFTREVTLKVSLSKSSLFSLSMLPSKFPMGLSHSCLPILPMTSMLSQHYSARWDFIHENRILPWLLL